MTDLTLDALVEDVARAMHRDAHYPDDYCWDAENEDLRTAWRSSARAALAAVAKAAGDRLGECSRDPLCPRVAALLRTLAEAARDE